MQQVLEALKAFKSHLCVYVISVLQCKRKKILMLTVVEIVRKFPSKATQKKQYKSHSLRFPHLCALIFPYFNNAFQI